MTIETCFKIFLLCSAVAMLVLATVTAAYFTHELYNLYVNLKWEIYFLFHRSAPC